MPYCKSCCFGFETKLGAKIIAFSGLVIAGLYFFISCVLYSNHYHQIQEWVKYFENKFMVKCLDWIFGIGLMLSIFGMLVNYMLLQGLRKSRSVFMLPWLIWKIIFLVVSILNKSETHLKFWPRALVLMNARNHKKITRNPQRKSLRNTKQIPKSSAISLRMTYPNLGLSSHARGQKLSFNLHFDFSRWQHWSL